MIYCSKAFYNFVNDSQENGLYDSSINNIYSRILSKLIVVDKKVDNPDKLLNITYFDVSKEIGFCLHKNIKEITYNELVDNVTKNKLNSCKIGYMLDKFSYHSPKTTELFINSWKHLQYNKKTKFEVVSGEDIRNYYLTKSYDTSFGCDGSLFSSCMNDNSDYFDIYCKNHKIIKMLILKCENGKIAGRCLLWETPKGLYMDRIYSTNDFINNMFHTWGKLNDVKFDYASKISKIDNNMIISLKSKKYLKYPYLDTFAFYYPKSGKIMIKPDYNPYGGFFSKLLRKSKAIKNGKMVRLKATNGVCLSPSDY